MAGLRVTTPAKPVTREQLQAFEEALRGAPGGQFEPELRQYFGHGIYMRQVFLPAGTLATGRIHKAPCWNILMVGRIQVATEQGLVELEAPQVFDSPAGTKRAVRAISDTMWITVHPYQGEARDGDAMADLLTVPSFEALASHCSPDSLLEE